jgi:hypothetical protein
VHSLFPQRRLQWCIPDYHGWVILIKQEIISYYLFQPRKHLPERARLPEVRYPLPEIFFERRLFLEHVLDRRYCWLISCRMPHELPPSLPEGVTRTSSTALAGPLGTPVTHATGVWVFSPFELSASFGASFRARWVSPPSATGTTVALPGIDIATARFSLPCASWLRAFSFCFSFHLVFGGTPYSCLYSMQRSCSLFSSLADFSPLFQGWVWFWISLLPPPADSR